MTKESEFHPCGCTMVIDSWTGRGEGIISRSITQSKKNLTSVDRQKLLLGGKATGGGKKTSSTYSNVTPIVVPSGNVHLARLGNSRQGTEVDVPQYSLRGAARVLS
ncbi:hypothetical protein K443DRAFT_469767 [Laccaria amethystina LaAM-08-1]|uniref:Uncharacterized protein n=1 Tax=Laccaria amethystina LaAM-08-1 TaxID=1095629 RepID=A0A0C9XPV6_9AGAR|nr:hypothetical protein K443DRAFT_469767 [Laccaria amethystina LaAM-08-1]